MTPPSILWSHEIMPAIGAHPILLFFSSFHMISTYYFGYARIEYEIEKSQVGRIETDMIIGIHG
jgi:hypothetical protein